MKKAGSSRWGAALVHPASTRAGPVSVTRHLTSWPGIERDPVSRAVTTERSWR